MLIQTQQQIRWRRKALWFWRVQTEANATTANATTANAATADAQTINIKVLNRRF